MAKRMNDGEKMLREALATIMLDPRLGPVVGGLDPAASAQALNALGYTAGFYGLPPVPDETVGLILAAQADGDVARAGGWRHSERDAHVALNAVFAAGTRPKGFNPLLGSRPAMMREERAAAPIEPGSDNDPAIIAWRERNAGMNVPEAFRATLRGERAPAKRDAFPVKRRRVACGVCGVTIDDPSPLDTTSRKVCGPCFAWIASRGARSPESALNS